MSEQSLSDGPARVVTAALLIIGNEILSGRTKDANLAFLGENLNDLGIQMSECRVVRDDEADIIAAVRALSERYDYVFTTGGIGPTHDDITCACIAKAFGAAVIRHPEAMRRLTLHYEKTGVEFNEMRQRMANIPDGASLIDNPVSAAPGFKIGNVYVMAGVPRIMQGMFDELRETMTGVRQKTGGVDPLPAGRGGGGRRITGNPGPLPRFGHRQLSVLSHGSDRHQPGSARFRRSRLGGRRGRGAGAGPRP